MFYRGKRLAFGSGLVVLALAFDLFAFVNPHPEASVEADGCPSTRESWKISHSTAVFI